VPKLEVWKKTTKLELFRFGNTNGPNLVPRQTEVMYLEDEENSSIDVDNSDPIILPYGKLI